jgi:hypothetical protein
MYHIVILSITTVVTANKKKVNLNIHLCTPIYIQPHKYHNNKKTQNLQR